MPIRRHRFAIRATRLARGEGLMVDSYVRKLFFHGAAVIWVGLLAGFPFGFVVMHRMEGDMRAWHMAHLEGVLNGLLTFGAAAALEHLSLDERRIPLYAWCFIVA